MWNNKGPAWGVGGEGGRMQKKKKKSCNVEQEQKSRRTRTKVINLTHSYVYQSVNYLSSSNNLSTLSFDYLYINLYVRGRRKNGIFEPKQSRSGTLTFMFLLSKKVNMQRMPHWGWEVCLLSHQGQVLRFENRVTKTMQSICERLGLSS